MGDPKGQLIQFLGKYLGRVIDVRTDILFATQKFPEGFQSTVTLPCLMATSQDGQAPEFAGELAVKQKDAEKNAAQQAVIAYAELISQLDSMPGKKNKGKKRPASEMAGMEGLPGMEGLAGMADMAGLAGMAGMAGMPLGANKQPLSKAELKAQFQEVPPNKEAMMKLNSGVGKVIRRPLGSGEVAYDSMQLEDGRHQCTVTILGLPPPFGGHPFQGMPYCDKQDAKHSAAEAALMAIMQDPSLSAQMTAPTVKKQFNPKGGKGKGKGYDKGYGKNDYGGGFGGGGQPGVVPGCMVNGGYGSGFSG